MIQNNPHTPQRTHIYAGIVTIVDVACMRLYAHARRNARTIARTTLALLPIMVLLVGSCKTSDTPGAYGSNAGPQQFRTALFPDRVNFTGMDYYPAEGYIARAQKYVAGTPESLALLTETEIAYLFGQPALKREEDTAKVWQYRATGCVVDFYFYDEVDAAKALDTPNIVSHVDVRNADQDVASRHGQAKCLDRVIRSGNFSSKRV